MFYFNAFWKTVAGDFFLYRFSFGITPAQIWNIIFREGQTIKKEQNGIRKGIQVLEFDAQNLYKFCCRSKST